MTSIPYAFRSGAVVSSDGSGVLTAANGESGTICVQGSANCGFILNQNSSTQTANFRIGGTGQADTSILSPALDVATAGALSIGTNTATSITLGSNTNNTAISLQSGTGGINIGTGSQARAINIGTGAAAQTVTIGSFTSGSTTSIQGPDITIGSSGFTSQDSTVNIANAFTGVQKIYIGNNTTGSTASIQGATIFVGSGDYTRQILIGTGNAPQIVTVGSTDTTSKMNIYSGTGGLHLETNSASAQIVAKSQTNGTGAFRVLNASETAVLNIDTTSPNLIGNSSFESGASGSFFWGAMDWATHGLSTIAQTNSVHYDNDAALSVATNAANQGARYGYSLLANTQYSLSMFVRAGGADFSTLEIGYSSNGSTDTSCATGQTAKLNLWVRVSCTFTTGSVSGTPYIYVKQTDSTGRTFYIDAVQLERSAAPTVYRNGKVSLSSLIINSGPLDAAASDSALQVNTLYGGNGIKVMGSGENNIFHNAFDVQTYDATSLFSVNETSRGTSIQGGSSVLGIAALNVTTLDGNANAVKITGQASGNAALMVIQGGATPGANADLLLLQNASSGTMFKVDNDGDATLARSLRVNYVSGATNQLNIQGPSGDFVTVNSANNKFFIGDVADCTSGRFCVAQTINDVGGASYTNTFNNSKMTFTSASTIIGQDIKVSDTSSGVNNLIRAVRIDTTGTSNSAATLNSFQIFIPTTSNTSLFGGNALQVQQANNTNIFKITNTGQALFQSTNNTATAFQILNSGGSAMFTLNTNGTDNGIYVGGTGGNVGGRIFFGATGDNAVWIGEDGSTDTNILSLNGNSGLKMIVGGSAVASFSSNGSLVLQNSTNSTNAVQIKNAAGTQLFNVDSTADSSNLVTNGSFEQNTNGWAGKSATISPTTSQAYAGTSSLQINTSAATDAGAKQDITLIAGQTYTLSFMARSAAGFTSFAFGYSADGSSEATYVTNVSTMSSTAWTKYSMTINPGVVTGTPYIFFKQTTNTARTFYIDAVQLDQVGNSYTESRFAINGSIISPMIFQNASDSTNAFGIYKSDNSSIFSVDTRNGRVGIGAGTPQARLHVVASSTGTAMLINHKAASGNILDLQKSDTSVVTVSNSGAMLLQPSADANNVFQVKNNGGTINALTVDTTGSTSVTVGGVLSVSGAATGDAFTVSNSSSTGNIATFKDNSTAVVTIADGGAFTLQNNVDSNFAFIIKSQANAGIMRVDSINRKIAIGNYSGTAADNIGAQLEILPVHDSRAGLSIKGYSPTYIARYIDVKNSDGADIFNVTANGDIITASGVFGTNVQNAAGVNSNSMSVISGNVTGAGASSGVVTVRSGTSSSGNTGALTLMSGNATGGNSGGITIDSGTATGTTGSIFIGTNNTSTVLIGNASKTQSVNIGSSFSTAANSTVRIASSDSATNTQTVVMGSSANAASSVSIEAGNTGGINIGTSATAHTINIGTGAAAQTINMGSMSGASATNIYSGSGGTTFKSTNGATAFRILNGNDVPLFAIDSSTDRVYIGNPSSDSTGALLVLDTKSGAGDPTGVAGGMYYNAALKKMRCYEGDGYWVDCRQSARSSYFFSTDFLGNLTGSAIGETLRAVGVSGAGNGTIDGETGHPGIMTHSGSTASGYAIMITRGNDSIRLGNGDAWRYETMVRLPNLSSNGGEAYTYGTGFIDSETASPTDGCYFYYTDSVNSGKWQGVCRNNGSSNESTCDTTISVTASQWYKLEVVVNAAGSSVDFKVDGVSKCQITSNIPTGSGRGTGFGSMFTKTGGSATRLAHVDYIEVNGQFGTAR